jgi:16S rRNA (uracil1498-N3)-methyltransferase
MRVPRIHVEEPVGGRSELWIAGDAAKHLQRVLRLQVGDELTVFDGSGGEHGAHIGGFEHGAVRIRLDPLRDVDRESPLAITLWQAPCRGDRMDHVIEKTTELGVSRIVPWLAKRAVVRLEGERAEQRRAHWQAVARSACEQSGRNRVPVVEAPRALEELIESCAHDTLRLELRPHASTRLADLRERPRTVVLAVGPEGGLTHDEETMLEHAHFLPLSLGPRILRADTAGAACIAALQALWGDG